MPGKYRVQTAARERHRQAQDLHNPLYGLGLAYGEGNGVQQDEAKAAELYAKAAMKGHNLARHNLGCIEDRRETKTVR